ncbi:MAG: hypothetical protein V4651_13655, partial [Bacteroidota bacterium]
MNNQSLPHETDSIIKRICQLLGVIGCLVIGLCVALTLIIFRPTFAAAPQPTATDASAKDTTAFWKPADIENITDTKQKELVAYGKELIEHTARYLGPKGSVTQLTNGMN